MTGLFDVGVFSNQQIESGTFKRATFFLFILENEK